LLNVSSRVNVNGAVDNSSYQLNVNGQANFSSGLSIAANSVLISTSNTTPAAFIPSAVVYSTTGYGTLIGCDNQFSTKYFGLTSSGNFIHGGGNATIADGSLTANNLFTPSGFGIVSGGNSFAISPSSTRGVININGSTDQFLTLASNGYILGSATLIRINATPDFDIVSGGVQRILISSTNGNAKFSSRVNVNGATDNSLFALNVSGTVNGSSPSFTGNTYTVTGNLTQQFYHILLVQLGKH